MATVYLNLGSNQGDRHALIEQAVALIASRLRPMALRRSDFFESEAWGYESEHRFINLGIALDLEATPEPLSLLRLLQETERRVGRMPHRHADGSYADRDIDIDIIAIDTLEIDTPALAVPHPRAAMRDFVMVPLRQLAPQQVVEHVENHRKNTSKSKTK